MAYTPNNTYIYLAAFTGAMSGMGGFTRGPTSGNPADYLDICRIATLFAKEVDTLLSGSVSDSLNVNLIQSLASGLYSGRYQNGQSQGDYAAQAGVLAAMATAAELACQFEIGPIPPYPPAGASATGSVQRVRAVSTFPLDNLASYIVLAEWNDGVTTVEGDIVILCGQNGWEKGYENGPWVVGPVTGSFAPLTRPSWWQAGSTTLTGAVLFSVGGEGEVYGNTVWRAMGPQVNGQVTTPGNIIHIGTDDPGLYPAQINTRYRMDNGEMMFYFPIISANAHTNVTNMNGVAHGGTVEYSVFLQPGSIDTNPYAVVRALASDGTKNTDDNGLIFFSLSNIEQYEPVLPPPP